MEQRRGDTLLRWRGGGQGHARTVWGETLPPTAEQRSHCHRAESSTLCRTAVFSSCPKATSTEERDVSSVTRLSGTSAHNLHKQSVLSAHQDLLCKQAPGCHGRPGRPVLGGVHSGVPTPGAR